ncbi:DUF2846 domain-containing protein [Acinetobacter calcoaceticus]|uniref:DUF2846 domain-containing protein n=1 Tax=Acinetobacter calcoaceticus TaxID=471 RepID=UPI0018FF3E17|nr:DUF2846 domain-containing protein [Acinetobacter calcoaceticus]MBJ9704998.1 DUF2846 domain-containing protein [Acinetobacter calcoaceticus]MBP2605927.1 hypothetical protein [Acinetobacter calcoaceticus]
MNIKYWLPILVSTAFVGCASVPQANPQLAQQAKQLTEPTNGNAAIYVYRSNNVVGSALKKDVWVDGECLGETARGIFFYKEVSGNQEHTVSTESEFSPNHLKFKTEAGKNYFVQQYIKPGVFVGGANLKLVDDTQGQKAINEYHLAETGKCSKTTIVLAK